MSVLLGSGSPAGATATDIAVVAVVSIGWLLIGRRAARRNVSSAMALVAAGLVLANGPWAPVALEVRSEPVLVLAEATLALLLFADASRVNLARLRRDAAVPVRLLVVGLPLTIAVGVAVAAGVLGGPIWVAAAIAAIVAPTDAALGAPIVSDRRVPERIRRTLNVESGLNDGIATPFVNLFLAAAIGELADAHGWSTAVAHLAVGAAVGAAAGLLGGLAARSAHRAGWMEPHARSLVAVFVATAAFTATLAVDGNGFIAAFVAGLAFGTTLREEEAEVTELAEEVGEALTLVVWFVFGAVLLGPALRAAGWREVAFAILALTVVRMVPVAVALAGTGLDRATVAFVGWFGPRGLASVVFTIIAIDELDGADARRVLVAATLTVAISVVAHGASASPLARRYGELARELPPSSDLLRARRPGSVG